MFNFLDSYIRLKIFSGEVVKVVYYENGVKKELSGYLEVVVGSDYIVCWDDDKKVKIPFFGDGCIIKSIELCNKDECCGKEDAILFYNSYEPSKDAPIDKEIKDKIFGTDIIYSSNETKYDFNPYFRFPYKEMFSSALQRSDFFEFLRFMIVELTNYCKENNLNPEFSAIGVGATSIVLSIGDKVVKFGTKRKKENIPYCEYLLQPLFNRDFKFDDRYIHMEVTQKVRKGTKEAADYISSQLMLIGLRPIDVDSFNVGLLDSKKENRIHFDGNIFFDVASDKATSILGNSNLHLNSNSPDRPFNGQFPVITDLDDIEIVDIDKYTDYLCGLGASEEVIKKVCDEYYAEVQKKKSAQL